MATAAPSSQISWSSVVETTAAAARESLGLEQEAADLAAIVELLEHVAAAASLSAALQTAAGELQKQVGCDRIAVGVSPATNRAKKSQTGFSTALSEIADFDAAAPLAGAIDDCLAEILLHGAATDWRRQGTDRAGLAAHRRLAETAGFERIVGIPLARAEHSPAGAAICLISAGQSVGERQLRFLSAIAGPLAAVLQTAQRGEQGRWLRTFKRFWGERIVPNRRVLLAMLAAVAVVVCLPVSYRVPCQCQVQPVSRRVVAAPFAGTLEKCFVKPGDVVRRNQMIGRMDGREIRWELAGLVAEQHRAAKSRDVSMAEDKVAAAQIDALDMQRLEVKRRLLADRADHLDIKAPIDGVVISGDLKRAEGAPVVVGQALYEIAPLGNMLVEVAIPDDEIAHVQKGQRVAISFDADPSVRWTGQLASIQPRAEARDNDNVFIAEVTLDNAGQTLRPGMKGRAKVEADTHTIAWVALHRPWNWLMAWLGW
jgi:multidrug resistance efflux pump